MKYLFKNFSGCEDIFYNLYDEMTKKYDCISVIEGDDSEKIILSLKNQKIKMIWSSHFNMHKLHKKIRPEVHPISWAFKKLNPILSFVGIHDLFNFRDIRYMNFENIIFLVPGEPWANWLQLKLPNHKVHSVGHPKFLNKRDVKYESIFFFSGVNFLTYGKMYQDVGKTKDKILEGRKDRLTNFLIQFKELIKNNIPIKLPDTHSSYLLIPILKEMYPSINILDPNLKSFDLLLQSKNCITNNNSSITIEGAIAGCNVINYINSRGRDRDKLWKKLWRFFPKSITSRIASLQTSEKVSKLLNKKDHKPLNEYKFNVNKAIKIVTQDNDDI